MNSLEDRLRHVIVIAVDEANKEQHKSGATLDAIVVRGIIAFYERYAEHDKPLEVLKILREIFGQELSRK